MRFADIPGHDDVKARLRAMVDDNQLPHALIIEGPEGTAKYALARAFVQYLNCSGRHDGDSCGRCENCRQIDALSHIDTFLSFPVVKKSGGSALSDDFLPDFRRFVAENPYMDFEEWLRMLDNINAQPAIYVDEAAAIIRKLGLTARRSRYKTLLMWQPERLQESAANKMLKLIEEPADDTLLILVSNNPKKVLPTIYSRTQRVAVRRYSDTEIAGIMMQYGSMDADSAAALARLSGGNVNTAHRLASVSKERQHFLDLFMELMRKAYLRRIVDLRKWSTDLAALGREPQMQFYDYCSRLLRENFILNLQVEPLTSLDMAERQFSVNFARFITNLNVVELLDTFGQARTDIAANGNSKIINFDVAIRVILLLKRDK